MIVHWIKDNGEHFMSNIEENIFVNNVFPVIKQHLKPLTPEQLESMTQKENDDKYKIDSKKIKKHWWNK